MSALAGRLADALHAASGAAMGALLIVLVGIDVMQVALRYGFGVGWPWAGDLTIVLLLSLAWIGVGHLWLSGGHIGVRLLPPQAARVADGAFALLALAAILLAVPMTWQAVGLYAAIDLPALPLPMAAKYVPVLGGLVWLGAAIALRLLARRRAG